MAVPPEPSLTVTVIVAEPNCKVAGVTLTFRLAPDPENTMFALGARVGFEEVPDTVRLDAEVSISPMVNGIVAVALPSSTV